MASPSAFRARVSSAGSTTVCFSPSPAATDRPGRFRPGSLPSRHVRPLAITPIWPAGRWRVIACSFEAPPVARSSSWTRITTQKRCHGSRISFDPTALNPEPTPESAATSEARLLPTHPGICTSAIVDGMERAGSRWHLPAVLIRVVEVAAWA